jgi:hypothetical protein
LLKILASLPESKHFRQTQNKGKRYQWADKATDNLCVLASDPDPWGKEWEILIRLEQGETRAGLRYPRRLTLLCLPVDPFKNLPKAEVVRERWKGNFAHSCEPTLLFFAFPVEGAGENNWLMLSTRLKTLSTLPSQY